MVPEDPSPEQAEALLLECDKLDLRKRVKQAARHGDRRAESVLGELMVEEFIESLEVMGKGRVFDYKVKHGQGHIELNVTLMQAVERIYMDFMVSQTGVEVDFGEPI